MAALDKILLGTGPDTSGTESFYSGLTKVNSNIDKLKSSSTSSSGASEIGFDDDNVNYIATTVQQALESIQAAVGEVNTISNLGTGEGSIWFRKNSTNHELKSLKAGANVSIAQTDSEITISSTVPAPNFPNIKKIQQSNYTIIASDEIILCDTSGVGIIQVNLTQGVKSRLVTIKNVASATNTANVVIVPYGTELVEDDRTGLPSTSVAIGTGSTIRISFFDLNNTWWII